MHTYRHEQTEPAGYRTRRPTHLGLAVSVCCDPDAIGNTVLARSRPVFFVIRHTHPSARRHLAFPRRYRPSPRTTAPSHMPDCPTGPVSRHTRALLVSHAAASISHAVICPFGFELRHVLFIIPTVPVDECCYSPRIQPRPLADWGQSVFKSCAVVERRSISSTFGRPRLHPGRSFLTSRLVSRVPTPFRRPGRCSVSIPCNSALFPRSRLCRDALF